MPFDIALTGLNAASSQLETISNNIANSNTSGFKRSRVEFADLYPVSNLGVTQNQTGLGVQIADISQQFSQGELTFTDNNLDLSISGRGFFRVSDNGTVAYSRAGAFGIDQSGFVVNNLGHRLTGFQTDSSDQITGALGDLRIDTADQPPRATTDMGIAVNLKASEPALPAFAVTPDGPDPSTYNHSTSTSIYDSLGAEHLASFYYRKSADNEWESYAFVDGAQVAGPDVLQFNGSGRLDTINGAAATTVSAPAFNPGGGADPMNLTLDYANISQFGAIFGVSSLSQDGFTTGQLSSVDIDASGVLFARYSNGQASAMGQIALSNFSNTQGLRQLGNTNWAESFASGAALTGAPGSSDLGLVQSGALEDSNVDITAELVHMITAQRSFQANAQVISTADDITQTIINIR